MIDPDLLKLRRTTLRITERSYMIYAARAQKTGIPVNSLFLVALTAYAETTFEKEGHNQDNVTN